MLYGGVGVGAAGIGFGLHRRHQRMEQNRRGIAMTQAQGSSPYSFYSGNGEMHDYTGGAGPIDDDAFRRKKLRGY